MWDLPPQLATLARQFLSEIESKKYQSRTLLLSLLTLISLVIYAAIAARQLSEMRKANRLTEDSVAISKKTLAATIDNFYLEQRAWVGVVSGDKPDLRPKSDFNVTLHALNSGHTPALAFNSEIVLRSLKKGEPFQPIYGKVPPGEEPSYSVVQPGESFQILSPSYPLDQSQIEAVLDGRFIL